MTFAQYIASGSHFYFIARQILDIFISEEANGDYDHYKNFHKKWPNDFFLESHDVSDSDPSKVEIKFSRWAGDQQDYDSFLIPIEWMDNFDEATIRAEAISRRENRLACIANAARIAAEEKEKKEKAQLKELLEKHGNPA